MREEFPEMNREEQLQAENDFLKMKLMLEKGAEFNQMAEQQLGPELENQFLNHVMEFEKQFEHCKTITVFEKIGKPTHFSTSLDIPDAEINQEWARMFDYLYDHGISLGVCSPNVSKRELYRFTMEELFDQEIDDINIPGMMQGFIYDEFHPDPIYENSRIATEECMEYFLKKDSAQWLHHFEKDNLRLNGVYPLTKNELKERVNRVKNMYDELTIESLICSSCIVDRGGSRVEGLYSLHAKSGSEIFPINGSWVILLDFDKEFEYWHIVAVEIEGIKFE